MAATYTARNDGMRGGTVEREKALEVALLQIEKQFGKGSVMRMGVDGPADPVQAISTGSLALDLALGIGGVPRGRVVEIYGPEASGKTTLALHIIAEAQKVGGIAAFIDSEHALDVTYARNLGVNTDELLISQPDTGEQALEIADMLIRSGALDVIVIDSVAALVPRAEIEGEMGDSHVGLQARLMSQALRKLSGTISKSKTTAIFINQLREKIGVLFGSPETTSGGRALKFYASIRLDVRRIESLKDGPEVVGNRTRAKVVKNKLAPPFRSAEFDVIYGQGISKEGSLLDVGVDVGLIKKSGAWFTYDGDQLGQGRENARNFLRDNPELAREIEEKVKAQLGIGLPLHRPTPSPPPSSRTTASPRNHQRTRTSSEHRVAGGWPCRSKRLGDRSYGASHAGGSSLGIGGGVTMVVGRRGATGTRRVQPGGGNRWTASGRGRRTPPTPPPSGCSRPGPGPGPNCGSDWRVAGSRRPPSPRRSTAWSGSGWSTTRPWPSWSPRAGPSAGWTRQRSPPSYATAASTRRWPSGPPTPPSRPRPGPTAAARSPRPASPSSPASPPQPSSAASPPTWPAAATHPTSPKRSPATWCPSTEPRRPRRANRRPRRRCRPSAAAAPARNQALSLWQGQRGERLSRLTETVAWTG